MAFMAAIGTRARTKKTKGLARLQPIAEEIDAEEDGEGAERAEPEPEPELVTREEESIAVETILELPGDACAADAQIQYETGPRRGQGDCEKHCDRRVRRREYFETQRDRDTKLVPLQTSYEPPRRMGGRVGGADANILGASDGPDKIADI